MAGGGPTVCGLHCGRCRREAAAGWGEGRPGDRPNGGEQR
uniref:Uncharacterized protein n=1 Tax=Arundo donax TaxID=35708 RepID=A0A0A8ZFK9_ARUDO